MSNKVLQIRDYEKLAWVSEPDFCSVREEVAYVVRIPDGNRYRSEIRTVCDRSMETGCGMEQKQKPEAFQGQRVSAGGKNEGQPLYAPDGDALAFLSDASGQVRIWLAKPEGEGFAQAECIGAVLPADFIVMEYLWQKNGKGFFVIGYRRMETKETPDAWRDPVIGTGGSYRKEGHGGWKEKREYALWSLGLPKGEGKCLYTSDASMEDLTLSLDGKRIWWNDGARYLSLNTEGFSDHTPQKPAAFDGWCTGLGSALADSGMDGIVLAAGCDGEEAEKSGMFGYTLACFQGMQQGETKGAFVTLHKKQQGELPDEVLPFLSVGSPFHEKKRSILKLFGENTFAVIGVKTGRVAVYLVKVEEEAMTWKRLTDGNGTILSISLGSEGCLYGVYSDMVHPYELVRISLADGTICRIAETNPWMAEKKAAEAIAWHCPSLDGKTTIHGRILKPDQEKETYPVVLLVHGGPTSFYSDEFHMEAQLLCAAGFAVVMANPRGSSGYGKVHAENARAYDGTAYEDLLYYLDRALHTFSWMDGEHMAVAGGSYGGYMAAWMAGHCKRFRTAVVMRGLLNFQFLCMTSEAAGQPGMFDSPESFEDWMMEQMKRSPTSYAGEMDLPMLIMHGEADTICPLDGAHQLYVGVKDTHPELPVRMVLFPKTGHNIRAGRLDYYERYEQELIHWIRTYIRCEEGYYEGLESDAF